MKVSERLAMCQADFTVADRSLSDSSLRDEAARLLCSAKKLLDDQKQMEANLDRFSDALKKASTQYREVASLYKTYAARAQASEVKEDYDSLAKAYERKAVAAAERGQRASMPPGAGSKAEVIAEGNLFLERLVEALGISPVNDAEREVFIGRLKKQAVRLEAVKTPRELARVKLACGIAEQAFLAGAGRLRDGLLETEAAELFHGPLATVGPGFAGVGRGGGFAWCMSGPNAAEAQGAYARSRPRPLQAGELVLVHCNAFADGFWIDVTRTFCLGDPDRRRGELFDAVLKARAAALEAVRPGARAADVDRAARGVLEGYGLGPHFRHPAGHGAGFHAIDHHARPRLHRKSDDVLEPGMVFNLEPAVYFDGECGLRHCDMVAVTADGHEVLTPFQATIDQIIVR
ncbi:MAG: aminopeptidase P family protein [Isosphaeraceae bacterium]|nr:aminopeptidase P family protein [Isosphaeraceae bacterium]